jgi:ATP-dependent RNA helicase RhlE
LLAVQSFRLLRISRNYLATDRRSAKLTRELDRGFLMSFAALGLAPELSRAVAENGYVVPTPIQAQAIPAVLDGRDVLAGAQTGTGKTAAFILPILQRLGAPAGQAPRALVLTPTRELAAQVAESARTYGKYVRLRTEVVFGGVSINPQIDALRRGCDLLVATPGRLLDLAEQGVLDLRQVGCFVLDEADRMLDMGFIHAIRQVIKRLPAQRQNLMFSATYSEEIRELAGRILRAPTAIEVAPRNATADRVDQQVFRVSKEDKRHLLAHLIQEGNWHQVLVFTRTKHGANRLAQQLESRGIATAAIHGNKSQAARVRALSDFKDNKVTALIATEVAARGLDIKELPHVVNYELPNVPQDYVHRIGRTARAGGTGCAVSLVSSDEASLLKDIERLLGKALPVASTPAFTIPPMQHVAPQEQSQGQSHGQRHAQGQRQGQSQRSGQSYGQGQWRGQSQRGGQSHRSGQGHGGGQSQRHGQEQRQGEGRGPRGQQHSQPRAPGEHRTGSQSHPHGPHRQGSHTSHQRSGQRSGSTPQGRRGQQQDSRGGFSRIG